jgi:hypothetical protein
MLPKRLVGWLKDMQNKITERKARDQIKSKDARVSKLTVSWNSHYSPGKLRKTLGKVAKLVGTCCPTGRSKDIVTTLDSWPVPCPSN